ncbi:MAG: porin family protein [Caulobacterales bacterium]|jgi:outer membrane immunogenic protein|nr:porin family protein [Caulobacterales bacterium]
MKKLVLAAVGAVAAMSGAARAEDWSGLYLGGHVGVANRESEWIDLDGDWVGDGEVASDDDVDATAFGAHAGYNWQFGNWVLGARGGFTYADLSETEIIFGDVVVDNSLSFTADARLNAGYSFGAYLPYATIGVAYSDLEHSWAEGNDTSDSWPDFSNDVATVYGAGLEYALSPSWSVGVEYLIYDFGSETSRNLDQWDMEVDTDSSVAQFTLNYRLD